jgi:hypothetical protein
MKLLSYIVPHRTPYHSGTPGFQWGLCNSIFSFMCMFCRSLFVLLLFSFGHCVVCSSIYGFWLPIWYLQARLTAEKCHSPASCLIGFLSYYSLPGHFLVMIHVSEVDVFSVLCHTKNALKRQRTFRNIKKLHDNVWIKKKLCTIMNMYNI